MPNFILENCLLKRKDPSKPIQMDESSMIVRGLDTTNNRFSTDGQGTHQSIGPKGAHGFIDMNLKIEEMWTSKSILYQIKEEEERDANS